MEELWKIHSGHQTEHKHRVGVLLSKQVAKSMMGFHALSDRILVVKIASKPFNLVIVQVYAPTNTSPEDEIEKFYILHEDRYGRSLCKSWNRTRPPSGSSRTIRVAKPQ